MLHRMRINFAWRPLVVMWFSFGCQPPHVLTQFQLKRFTYEKAETRTFWVVRVALDSCYRKNLGEEHGTDNPDRWTDGLKYRSSVITKAWMIRKWVTLKLKNKNTFVIIKRVNLNLEFRWVRRNKGVFTRNTLQVKPEINRYCYRLSVLRDG